MADCFEHEVADKAEFDEKAQRTFFNPKNGKVQIDPMVAKAFWKQATGLFDAGKDWEGTIDAMHKASGLKPETISRILLSDRRMKAITNDMWLKRAKYGEISQHARELVNMADTPQWSKNLSRGWNLLRTSATLGHGGVFPFTHARGLLLTEDAGLFAQTVKRAWSYATSKGGAARHAEDMAKLQLRDSYKGAARAGLDIKPGTEPVGILSAGAKGWGRRGFDSLKTLRLDLWDKWSKKVGVDLRDEATARQLAREINYATGSVQLGRTASRMAGSTLFAPKLWFAKRMEAFQPIRYLANAGKMTPGQRAVANIALSRWAKMVTATGGILAANDQFNKYVLGNKHRVNFADFSQPGSLWRMNVGGQIVPLSPMVEVIRTPVAMVAALMADKKRLRGDAPLSFAAQIALRDFLNAVHPSLSFGVEQISGREAYGKPGSLRRLPYPGVAQLVRGEEKEKVPPITWGENISEKGPIPLSSFVRSLMDEGVDKSTAENWVEALTSSALSGGVGVHTHPESQPKPAKGKRTKTLMAQ